MLARSVIRFWVVAAAALLGWPEASTGAAAEPFLARTAATSPSLVDRSHADSVFETDISVKSNDSSPLDNEVEIPDEPNNDDSDDFGETLSREGPTATPRIDVGTPTPFRPALACRVCLVGQDAEGHNLFSFRRLCRLLI